MHRFRRAATALLALLIVFTITAGAAVARMLPPRLALWRLPTVASHGLAGGGPVLVPVTDSADGQAGSVQAGHSGYSGQVATAAGVAAALAPLLGSATLGSHVGAIVDDLSSGQVLLSRNAGSGFAPASTAKLAVAVAALDVLGPAATFSTKVVIGGGASSSIVLVGGGDPTLAAGHPPASDYPQPATLVSLAAQTARALRAKGIRAVRLGYDTSLFTGPLLAPGWPDSYVTTGNVTPISSLEVDQGRLTASGAPQDANDPENFRARTFTPAAEAAQAFAGFLAGDGIRVRGAVSQTAAPHGTATIAAVASPPLADIVDWMLTQSNNVIAENLARQVAIAVGRPPRSAARPPPRPRCCAGSASAARSGWSTGAACRRRTGSRPTCSSSSSVLPRHRAGPACGPSSPACRWPGSPARWPRAAASSPTWDRPGSAWCGPRPATCRPWWRWPESRRPGTVSCSRSRSWPTG